jgi:hypothetical protein
VIDRVREFLGEREAATHREIEAHLVSRGDAVVAARLGLKLVWERGGVAYHNCSTAWNREVRTFRIEPSSAGTSRTSRAEGSRELLAAYLQAYGPATVRDAAWWSGLSRRLIAATLAELDVVTLRLPWAASSFFMCRDRWESFLSADVADDAVNLLAHEDIALKAYHESRSRYLGGLDPAQAFNSIGEVLPTVLVGGRVVGRWHWDGATRTVMVRPFDGRREIPVSTALTERIDAMSDMLSRGWSARVGSSA